MSTHEAKRLIEAAAVELESRAQRLREYLADQELHERNLNDLFKLESGRVTIDGPMRDRVGCCIEILLRPTTAQVRELVNVVQRLTEQIERGQR